MKPKGIIIHHPAWSVQVVSQRKGDLALKAIRDYHVKTLGWRDSGYHWIVNEDTNGSFKAYDGRPDNLTGAHTLGFNDWLGISVVYGMGTKPKEAQLITLAKLIAGLCKKHGIPIDSKHIKGHRDMPGHRSNACPGNELHALIPTVIKMAQAEANPPKNFPKQKEAKSQPIEKHINDIPINLPGNKHLTGVLLNDATHIHISALNEILKALGHKEVNIEYIPAQGGQTHFVKIR